MDATLKADSTGGSVTVLDGLDWRTGDAGSNPARPNPLQRPRSIPFLANRARSLSLLSKHIAPFARNPRSTTKPRMAYFAESAGPKGERFNSVRVAALVLTSTDLARLSRRIMTSLHSTITALAT